MLQKRKIFVTLGIQFSFRGYRKCKRGLTGPKSVVLGVCSLELLYKAFFRGPTKIIWIYSNFYLWIGTKQTLSLTLKGF